MVGLAGSIVKVVRGGLVGVTMIWNPVKLSVVVGVDEQRGKSCGKGWEGKRERKPGRS